MNPSDREIAQLERELEDVRDDPELYEDERAVRIREIKQQIGDIEREAADQERWENEGRERGWVSW